MYIYIYRYYIYIYTNILWHMYVELSNIAFGHILLLIFLHNAYI